jgi:hypothetical protein
MRERGGALALAVLTFVVTLQAQAPQPPEWAYASPPGGATPLPADETELYRIPGTPLAFTMLQLRDPFGPADWFPESHPPMPEIVAQAGACPRLPKARAVPF